MGVSTAAAVVEGGSGGSEWLFMVGSVEVAIAGVAGNGIATDISQT